MDERFQLLGQLMIGIVFAAQLIVFLDDLLYPLRVFQQLAHFLDRLVGDELVKAHDLKTFGFDVGFENLVRAHDNRALDRKSVV